MAGKRAVDSDGEGERSSVASQKRARTETVSDVAPSPLKTVTNNGPVTKTAQAKVKAKAAVAVASESESEAEEAVPTQPQASSSQTSAAVQDDEGDDDDDEGADISEIQQRPALADEDDESDLEVNEDDEDEDEPEVQKGVDQMREESKTAGAIRQAGVMEQLELQNFMCHTLLKIEFGPQINFVIGHNGSGKSAILTAVTLALGGKASQTQRGTSLKGFIKNDTSQAKISLRLGNRGDEAFHPETYGKSITIERTLNRDGSGGYKLKGSNNKTVSTKKEHLQAMLDHWGIQPDSPLCILSQDNSRQFLAASKSREKYGLFIRGTQLQQLLDDYADISQSISTMRVQYTNKKEVIPELHKVAKIQKDRFADAEKAQSHGSRLGAMRKELAWAYIWEDEKSAQNQENVVRKEEQTLEDFQAKIEHGQEEAAAADYELTQLDEEQNHNGDSSKEEELEARKDELKRQIAVATNEAKACHAQMRPLGTAIQDIEKQIAEQHKLIREEDAKVAANSDGSRQEMSERMATLNAESETLRQDLMSMDRQLTDMNRQGAETQKQTDELDGEIQAARQAWEHINSRAQHIQRTNGNRLAAYGNHAATLVNAIDRERGWVNQPLGPLGRYCHIVEKEWAQVIETVLTNDVGAFVVTCVEDERRLRGMMKHFDHHANIIRTRCDIFDFQEPDPQYLTLLRAMKIDDEFVKRVLINSKNIESSVLIPDRTVADEFMRHPPAGVTNCYSPKHSHGGAGRGGLMSQGLSLYKGVPRLTDDVQSALDAAKAELHEIEQRLHGLQQQRDQLKRSNSALGTELRNLKNERGRKEKRIERNTQIAGELEDKLAQSQPSNVEAILDIIKAFEEEKTDAKRQLDDIVTRRTMTLQAIQPAIQEKEGIDRQLKELTSVHETWRLKMEACVTRRRVILTKIDEWTKKAARQTEKIDAEKLQHQGILQKIEENLVDAVQICPERLPYKKTSKKLISEMQGLENAIQAANRRQGGSIEQIRQDYADANRNYQSAEKACHELALVIRLLKASLHTRINAWKMFKKHISVRAKMMFVYHLSKRGFGGKLNFNHDKGRLDIQVRTDQVDGTSRLKDVKSLSGGEKSYTTISLLLTLWDAVACPLRCLDEFDVFMDAANRKIAVDMMLDSARHANEVQYCFITPQDLGGVKVGPETTVNRMDDPQRGRGTLQAS